MQQVHNNRSSGVWALNKNVHILNTFLKPSVTTCSQLDYSAPNEREKRNAS